MLVLWLAAGWAALAAEREALPQGALAVVELRGAKAAWGALRDTVAAVSGAEGADAAERELAGSLGAEAWDAPVAYVLCLAAEGGAAWRVAWPAGPKAPAGAEGVGGWAFRGGEAGGERCGALAAWLAQGGLADGPGQISAAVDVAKLMAAHEPGLSRELAAMKARMMEAEGVMDGQDTRGSLRAAQVELDAAVWLARQVERMTFEVEMGRAEVFVSAKAAAIKGSVLEAWLEAQPKGDLSLLARCPADALAAGAWGLDLSGAAGEALARSLGLRLAARARGQAGFVALALAPAAGGGAAFDAVGLASGAAAGEWQGWWRALSAEGMQGWPLRLQPVEADGGMAMADVIV
ncbi:MAG TPA: hypothetical protein P5137_14365, partial [Candidatus Brocadiia bacterium]|nr:hypothetical protein [Candidatus Brocadiia bacterium]